MFKNIGFIVLIALLIGKATRPGAEKLKNFAKEKISNDNCQPMTVYNNFQVCAIGYAYECKSMPGKTDTTVNGLKPLIRINTDTTKPKNYLNYLLPGKKHKYLGLFGKWWEL